MKARSHTQVALGLKTESLVFKDTTKSNRQAASRISRPCTNDLMVTVTLYEKSLQISLCLLVRQEFVAVASNFSASADVPTSLQGDRNLWALEVSCI